MHIMFASPQAACLRIFFVGKSVVLHLFEGPELRTHYREDREEKKITIRTRDVYVMRRRLYPCATTAALTTYKLMEPDCDEN